MPILDCCCDALSDFLFWQFLEALKGDGVEKWAYYHKEVDERRGYFKRDFSEEWFDLELELQLVCEVRMPFNDH